MFGTWLGNHLFTQGPFREHYVNWEPFKFLRSMIYFTGTAVWQAE